MAYLNGKLKNILKTLWHYLLIMLATVIVMVVLRVFLFASYKIPSSSMEPAIVSGDYIIVNKLIPGTRIIKNEFSIQKGETPDLIRLKGYRDVRRNDVLVFNYPSSHEGNLDINLSKYYAKRCVAIPGDTFFIENGIYKVKGVSDTLGYYAGQYSLSRIANNDFDSVIYRTYPFNDKYKWNVKNFGPLYVPQKDCTIQIDTLNIVLYEKLISYETKQKIKIEDATVYLGDSVISNYTFCKNYYFMAGDLSLNSQDSRYWGLLPEDHIVGKAEFVWKSVDPQSGKYRFDRTFKLIR